jgi:DNA invertase Pin-like site-specific DNA recombinase
MGGMQIGYARVSTEEQNLEPQRQALTAAGCAAIFEDLGVSGAADDRPGLTAALARIGAGDSLVVWKLDRLGRSLGHLIETVSALKDRGVGFASISESIDTTTPGGKLFFHMMGALAEFERDLIVERTKAGIEAARQRGQHLGRPRKLNATQLKHARKLITEGTSRNEVARILDINPSTLYRNLQRCA